MKDSKPKLEEEYPEHLRHLYTAEQQRLNEEEQLNKDRRRKGRCIDVGEEESVISNSGTRTSETRSHEESAASFNEGPQTSQTERFVILLYKFTRTHDYTLFSNNPEVPRLMV